PRHARKAREEGLLTTSAGWNPVHLFRNHITGVGQAESVAAICTDVFRRLLATDDAFAGQRSAMDRRGPRETEARNRQGTSCRWPNENPRRIGGTCQWRIALLWREVAGLSSGCWPRQPRSRDWDSWACGQRDETARPCVMRCWR